MSENNDRGVAVQFRGEPEYIERLDRHAKTPKYFGRRAHYVRNATTLQMDLEDALGPRFELVISELIDGAEAEKALAA